MKHVRRQLKKEPLDQVASEPSTIRSSMRERLNLEGSGPSTTPQRRSAALRTINAAAWLSTRDTLNPVASEPSTIPLELMVEGGRYDWFDSIASMEVARTLEVHHADEQASKNKGRLYDILGMHAQKAPGSWGWRK
jgi:hypothetical protein